MPQSGPLFTVIYSIREMTQQLEVCTVLAEDWNLDHIIKSRQVTTACSCRGYNTPLASFCAPSSRHTHTCSFYMSKWLFLIGKVFFINFSSLSYKFCFCYCHYCFVCWDAASRCSPGWHYTWGLPASVFWALGLHRPAASIWLRSLIWK